MRVEGWMQLLTKAWRLEVRTKLGGILGQSASGGADGRYRATRGPRRASRPFRLQKHRLSNEVTFTLDDDSARLLSPSILSVCLTDCTLFPLVLCFLHTIEHSWLIPHTHHRHCRRSIRLGRRTRSAQCPTCPSTTSSTEAPILPPPPP